MAKTKEVKNVQDKPLSANAVVFIDKAYKSRVIVIGQKTVQVEKGTVTTDDAEIITHLEARSDFERVPKE